ncbi:MAG: hypothetical protein K2W93_07940, partial [Burkholderiaceae bacterium]|nr:hypothetical protein [Burkholderiaceae bacterium]
MGETGPKPPGAAKPPIASAPRSHPKLSQQLPRTPLLSYTSSPKSNLYKASRPGPRGKMRRMLTTLALLPLGWLSLGSEGRAEQTIATDQDNAIILNNDVSDESRETVRHFAHAVNLALDTCGY